MLTKGVNVVVSSTSAKREDLCIVRHVTTSDNSLRSVTKCYLSTHFFSLSQRLLGVRLGNRRTPERS